jgi:hypothetical protein
MPGQPDWAAIDWAIFSFADNWRGAFAMRIRAIALVVLFATPLFALTACIPETPPAPPASSAPPAPSTAPSAAPLADDILLHLTATATAENGAVLDLTLNVHKSTAWNDPAGASRAALMSSVCEGALDDSVFEANLWSFAQIDLSAVANASTPAWPGGKRLRVMPYSTHLALASTGDAIEDPDVSGETPHCKRDRYLLGAGESTLVVGFQGDTDASGAAGNFTRWANHLYGFVGREVAGQTAAQAGITITGCDYQVTTLGESLNGGASWWHEQSTPSECYVGSSEPEDDDS